MGLILITVMVLGYVPISRLIKLHALNLWSFFKYNYTSKSLTHLRILALCIY